MDNSNIQTIQTVVLCVVGLFSSAMIPFAVMVVSRLTRIETQISNGLIQSVALLSENMVKMASRMHDMEMSSAKNDGIEHCVKK